MKRVTNKPSFQGEFVIWRIDAIPPSATVVSPVNGVHIIAHSETGHHHVIEARSADRFIDEVNEFISYLNVASDDQIKHLRDFDTHEPLHLSKGIYQIKAQREYIPEGFRRAID